MRKGNEVSSGLCRTFASNTHILLTLKAPITTVADDSLELFFLIFFFIFFYLFFFGGGGRRGAGGISLISGCTINPFDLFSEISDQFCIHVPMHLSISLVKLLTFRYCDISN